MEALGRGIGRAHSSCILNACASEAEFVDMLSDYLYEIGVDPKKLV